MVSRGRYSLNSIPANFPSKPLPLVCSERASELASCVNKAGDEARTRDSLLGRQELYH